MAKKEEQGKLEEWMTVARDRSAWGQRVEYFLELPPGSSFTNLRRHWTKMNENDDWKKTISLDRRLNGKKQNYYYYYYYYYMAARGIDYCDEYPVNVGLLLLIR
jgi:hypothetical protein